MGIRIKRRKKENTVDNKELTGEVIKREEALRIKDEELKRRDEEQLRCIDEKRKIAEEAAQKQKDQYGKTAQDIAKGTTTSGLSESKKKNLRRIAIVFLCIVIGFILFLTYSELTSQQYANSMIIYNFQVTPTLIEIGGTANLTWQVIGATSVNINNNIGTISLNGTKTIQPTETTTYTLTATNETDSITMMTSIFVEVPTSYAPEIVFMQDEENNNLTVVYVSESGLDWDNIQIIGTATKPTGIIDVDDSITGCSDIVTVSWKNVHLYGVYTIT